MRDPPWTCDSSLVRRPLLCVVEGANDISFLTILSRQLSQADSSLPDLGALAEQGRLVFVPFGGGNPVPWTSRFAALGCREFHLYDRERPPESAFRLFALERIGRRPGCRAFLTTPRALENYLHPLAIAKAGAQFVNFGPDDCVATEVARQSISEERGRDWTVRSRRERQKLVQRTKHWLNSVAVQHMTPELLAESDPLGDVCHWLRMIGSMLPSEAVACSDANCDRSRAG